MRALVTGATGFVGHRLLLRLEEPVVLSRDPVRARESLAPRKVTAFPWRAADGPPPAEAFDGVDCVIHLAGESVGEGRWNEAKKNRIRESRVAGTRNLVEGIARLDKKPRVLVSASAVGYYGSRGDQVLTESASPGDDFLAEVCIGWEEEAAKARRHDVRVVSMRTGVVLGSGGGALAKMLTPFRLGVGGRLGDGRQWMPWIHIDDLVGIILHSCQNDSVSGPVNGTAPNPVTNFEFTKTLGRVLKRPTVFPMPRFMLRLALGEFGDVLLTSQRAVPEAAQKSGYEFQYPDLEGALRAILKR
jgi:uncharacterized protein (TIGR01777 family)